MSFNMTTRRVFEQAWAFSPSSGIRRGLPLSAARILSRGVANEGVARDLMTGELSSLPDIEVKFGSGLCKKQNMLTVLS